MEDPDSSRFHEIPPEAEDRVSGGGEQEATVVRSTGENSSNLFIPSGQPQALQVRYGLIGTVNFYVKDVSFTL